MQALLFDLYGTLADEIPAYSRFLHLRIGIEENIDSFIRQWFIQQRKIISAGEYQPFREVLRKSLMLASEKEGVALPHGIENEDFLGLFSNIEPFPEVPKVLRGLKEKAKIGILTNSDDYALATILPKLGVQADIMISAEAVQSYKPNRQNYQKAVESLALPVLEILYVSGTPWDVKAAESFGFKVAFVERHALPPESKPAARYIIKDLNELVQIVLEDD